MGKIVVDVHLENLHDRTLLEGGYREEAEIRSVTIQAVANTGAMMLALPQDVVDELGLEQSGSVATTTADGQRGILPVAGPLTLRIGNRQMTTDCVVFPVGVEPLIGQIVMRSLDLIVDFANQALGPRPESPDRPLLRV